LEGEVLEEGKGPRIFMMVMIIRIMKICGLISFNPTLMPNIQSQTSNFQLLVEYIVIGSGAGFGVRKGCNASC
jgi:hypothetical protein